MTAATLPSREVVDRLLQRAVDLSHRKMTERAGGPFGAVIARGDRPVAEGWNRVTSENDPTAHAEVSAIRNACRELGSFELSGHWIYSSCEPCPMCLGAIYWARLDGIVYANTRLDAARIGFDDAHFYDQMALDLNQQKIATLHLPTDEAQRVFDAWLVLADKVEY